MGKIWVKNTGSSYVGWAVDNATGAVVALQPNGSWAQVTQLMGDADLAVYDTSHVAVTDMFQTQLFDGSGWNAVSTQAFGTSVAWAGSAVVAAEGTSVQSGVYSSGSVAWNGRAFAPGDGKVVLRYLVSRLDGPAFPLDSAGRPAYVMDLISNSVASDSLGRAGALAGNWVLEDSPASSFDPGFITAMQNAGVASILHCGDSAGWADETFHVDGINGAPLIGYSSSESYNYASWEDTTLFRPFNTYVPGAVAITHKVSTDGRSLREPVYIEMNLDTAANPEPHTLKVYLWPYLADHVLSTGEVTWDCGLWSNYSLVLYGSNGNQLGQAYFGNTGSITNDGCTLTVPTARIDLSGVNWPSNHITYFAVICSSGDQYYGGQAIGVYPGPGWSLTPYLNNQVYAECNALGGGGGATYTAWIGQSLASEMIAEGASATTGNVNEPFGTFCPDPEAILYQYSQGMCWGESAMMGMPKLGWMETVVGDPLMSPFSQTPSVNFIAASPSDGDTVTGEVALNVDASPSDSAGQISYVRFMVNDQQIALVTQPPYQCVWNTTLADSAGAVYPDGNHTIQAAACQTNPGGTGTSSLNVTVNNTTGYTVAVTQPTAQLPLVTAAAPVTAQPSDNPDYVKFWLFSGSSDPIGITQAGPYYCTIDSTAAPDGVYSLQAAAYEGDSMSYSPPLQVAIVNSSPVFTSVAGMSSVTDGTFVYLVNVPVVAGTSPAMGNAFYVEDASRAAGIRVAWSGPVDWAGWLPWREPCETTRRASSNATSTPPTSGISGPRVPHRLRWRWAAAP